MIYLSCNEHYTFRIFILVNQPISILYDNWWLLDNNYSMIDEVLWNHLFIWRTNICFHFLRGKPELLYNYWFYCTTDKWSMEYVCVCVCVCVTDMSSARARKLCMPDGTWFRHKSTKNEWTDFMACVGESKVADNIRSSMRWHIAVCSMSVIALLPALVIFFSYRWAWQL